MLSAQREGAHMVDTSGPTKQPTEYNADPSSDESQGMGEVSVLAFSQVRPA